MKKTITKLFSPHSTQVPLYSAEQNLIVTFLTLRKAVGLMGSMLPLVLVLGTYIFSDCDTLQDAISDYYYTVMGNYFVGSLCAVALFMFSYKGYDTLDRVTSNLSGLFALGIAFFPTNVAVPNALCYIRIRDSSVLVSNIHNISAGLFFVILAYTAIFLFTKTSSSIPPSPQKLKRNIVYRVCGIIILLAIIMVFITLKISSLRDSLVPYKLVFWLESIALLAFGISWLIKGEFLLKDE